MSLIIYLYIIYMDNNNLISINKLKNIIKQKNLNKYINDVGYSKVKNKKYYVITIDNKKVNFGDMRYQDKNQHNDKKRVEAFKARFNKVYEKFKDDYNKPIFWVYQILW